MEIIAQKFFDCPEYIAEKQKYEKQCFKVFGDYYRINSQGALEPQDIKQMVSYFKNKLITLNEQNTETKNGKTITFTKEFKLSFFDIWSRDPSQREYEEVVFECDKTIINKKQYNLFDDFHHLDAIKIQQDNDYLTPIFEQIDSLTGYCKGGREYVLSWLSHIVQKPHLLPNTCLVFIGSEGSGKDQFASFLSKVLNENYYGITTNLDNITGRFNSSLAGKLLYVVNETDPIESSQRAEKIKFVVTASEFTMEKKFKDPIKVKNFSRFIFFSNKLFAFPMDAGARRPVIYKTSDKFLISNMGEEQHMKHWTNLIENHYKNPECQKAFLEYLRKYDIGKWNPRDFEKSNLHKDLDQANIPIICKFLIDLLENNKEEKMMSYKARELYLMFKEFSSDNKYPISEKSFCVELPTTYEIEKKQSNGVKYVIDTEKLKKLITAKFKYNFEDECKFQGKNETTDDENEELEVVDYETKYKEALKEIELLKKQLENLQKPKVEIKEEQIIEEVKKNVKQDVKISIKPTDTDEEEEDMEVITTKQQLKRQKNAQKKEFVFDENYSAIVQDCDISEIDDLLNDIINAPIQKI